MSSDEEDLDLFSDFRYDDESTKDHKDSTNNEGLPEDRKNSYDDWGGLGRPITRSQRNGKQRRSQFSILNPQVKISFKLHHFCVVCGIMQ